VGHSTRYVHTNVVVQDWRRLARFYERVFGGIWDTTYVCLRAQLRTLGVRVGREESAVIDITFLNR